MASANGSYILRFFDRNAKINPVFGVGNGAVGAIAELRATIDGYQVRFQQTYDFLTARESINFKLTPEGNLEYKSYQVDVGLANIFGRGVGGQSNFIGVG